MKSNKHPIQEEKEVLLFGTITIVFCLVIIMAIWAPVSISGITGNVIFESDNSQTLINYDNISLTNITKSIASSALMQAEEDIIEMKNDGLGIVFVNDTLTDAKKFFDGENYTELLNQIKKIKDKTERANAKTLIVRAQKNADFFVDYEKVLEKTRLINDKKYQAYELKDTLKVELIKVLELNKSDIDFSSVITLINSAEISFNEERFDEAEEILSTLNYEVDLIQSENTLVKTVYRAGRENIFTFIKDHWINILITVLIILGISVLSYNRIRLRIYKVKFQNMKVEKEVLMDLIKKAQLDYYQNHKIDKKNYEIKFNSYKDRVSSIKRQLPGLRAKIKKIANLKRFL